METLRADRYLFLDAVAGWRVASAEGLVLTGGDGFFRLRPLPGMAARLLGDEVHEREFRCPAALAWSACGALLVVDAALHQIKRIRFEKAPAAAAPTEMHGDQTAALVPATIETLPAIGGAGEAPRQLREPRGVAVLPSGAVVVADTANHRIQIFSPAPYALLQVWGAVDAGGRPVPGNGPKEFRWPWAVAVDRCGAIYVADRGNRRIQKIGSDGEPRGTLGAGELTAPTRLAVSADGVVAVIDSAMDQAGNDTSAVCLFPHGATMQRLAKPARPRCVTFAADGTLYVGDANGVIHVLVPDAAVPEGYRSVGEGVTGHDDAIVDLVWHQEWGLTALIREQETGIRRQRLWRINPAGSFASEGSLSTVALDSKIERCTWHRVALEATVPPGTSIQIETATDEEPLAELDAADARAPGLTDGASMRLLTYCAGDAEPQRMTAGASQAPWKLGAISADANPDCLVQSGPGRHLRLRVTLRSNGTESPTLRSISVFFPRVSYLQYLPAVYQEDEESRLFLDRFLSIFQTEFDSLDRRLDALWQLFDPASIDEKHLPWLSGLLAVAIRPDWSSAKLRDVLMQAAGAYRQRGTAQGLEQTVRDWGGVAWVRLLEHFRLRRWPALNVASAPKPNHASALAAPLDGTAPLWSRDFYRRLQVTSYSQVGHFRLTDAPEPALEPLHWGAHQFTVFFPVGPYDTGATEARVAALVEQQKPAHTQAHLCPVYPRFRVGIQATLGVDSVVGGISHLVLNHLATLNYDTILACSATEEGLRDLGTSLAPRTGITTRLL